MNPSTVAGGGRSYPGDSGPATAARLFGPSGVAVDDAGNLYVAETGNSRVCKVSPAGIITTIAGNGWYGNSGDGGPATSAQLWEPAHLAVDSAGRIFVADYGLNNAVRLLTPRPR